MRNEELIDDCFVDDRIYNVISSSQFDADFLEKIFKITDVIKIMLEMSSLSLKSLLNDKSVMLYFNQSSSRTFLSFITACKKLGMDAFEIRDPRISSEAKGETEEDSIKTFSQFVDLIIMRNSKKDFARKCTKMLKNFKRRVPIINGGSGQDEHPTQALLDIYTIQQALKNFKENNLKDKIITMVGDLKRGRTIKSLSYLLCNYPDVKINYVSPANLKIDFEIKKVLDEHGVEVKEYEELTKEILKETDIFYLTRIQDEYDKVKGETKSFYPEFSLQKDQLAFMKDTSFIMHPLPRRKRA